MALLRGLLRGATAAAIGHGRGKLKRRIYDDEKQEKREATDFAFRKFASEEGERRTDNERQDSQNRITNSRQQAELDLARARDARDEAKTPGEREEHQARLDLLKEQLKGTTDRNKLIGKATPQNPRQPTYNETRQKAADDYFDSLVKGGMSEEDAAAKAKARYPRVFTGRPGLAEELKAAGINFGPSRSGGPPK